VPLWQLRWAEAELPPGDTETGDRALTFQMVEIGARALSAKGMSPTPSLRLNQIW
jgi:hypothetical protein